MRDHYNSANSAASPDAFLPGLMERETRESRAITHGDLALPASCAKPFSSPSWVFEVEYQGYRCLGQHGDGHAQLVSRDGRDLSRAFPELVEDLRQLPSGTAIDGELVMLDEMGRPLFEQLLARSAVYRVDTAVEAARNCPATFFASDILMMSGQDLRRFPLLARKVALNAALAGLRHIYLANYLLEHGERLYAEAVSMRMASVVAKRVDSRYTAGRSEDWLEIRCHASGQHNVPRMPATYKFGAQGRHDQRQ